MTRLLYLPDDATVIQLESEMSPSQLAAAVNAGMRPAAALQSAPPGALTAIQAGKTVIVIPAESQSVSAEKAALTQRQAQIFELSTRGLSTGEIALLLHLSIRTVNYHLNKAKMLLRNENLRQE